jgi:hypothetical protein
MTQAMIQTIETYQWPQNGAGAGRCSQTIIDEKIIANGPKWSGRGPLLAKINRQIKYRKIPTKEA